MSKLLWTLNDMVAAGGGAIDGAAVAGISGISIDTRSIETGDLFVALQDVRDGHDFVTAAFEKGAAAALVAKAYARKPGDGLLIRVDDPLGALKKLAAAARARLSPDARVVAVTGSAGKTTSKEMLRAMFGAIAPGRVHASEKSYNNHWGVPLTLARMPADTLFAVIEIGMNHPGEIRPLSNLARPHVALITTVAPAHLGQFKNLEEIAEAKAEIFEGLAPGSCAVVPADSPFALLLARRAIAGLIAPEANRLRRRGNEIGDARCDRDHILAMSDAELWELLNDGSVVFEVLTFGEDERASVSVRPERLSPLESEALLDLRHGETYRVTVALPGRHNLINASGCLAASLCAGQHDLGMVIEALAKLRLSPEGRGQVYTLAKGITLIDESYNANPASMRAALATLALYPRTRRRIAVLGDMLELGADSAALHAGLAEPITGNGVDLLFTCGPMMHHLFDAVEAHRRGAHAPDAAALLPLVQAALRPGDVVMVKASNGSKLGPLVAALKQTDAAATAQTR